MVWISYFSMTVDKHHDEKRWKEERAYFGQWFQRGG